MIDVDYENQISNIYLDKRLEEEIELSYLELDQIPEEVHNPFNLDPFNKVDPVDEIIKIAINPDYLYFTAKHILNIELLPYQLAILDVLWNKRLPMIIATRGASKSFLLAVYAILRLVLNPGCRVVICGSSFRQSRQVHEYMTNIWDKAPVLKDIAGTSKIVGPRREVDRCQFTVGNSHAYSIPIGDGCLSADTLITYDNCFGTIADDVLLTKNNEIKINQRDRYLWSNGKFRLSDEAYYNGVKPTKKIKTSKGYSFEATHNHKMKILRGGKITWCRSDGMIIGDKILIDRTERWHNGSISQSIEECYNLGLKAQDEVDKVILSAEKQKVKAYLQGVFDSNSSNTDTKITLSNVSEKLIDQIHYILLHYGIVASKVDEETLEIFGDDFIKFIKKIDPLIIGKQNFHMLPDVPIDIYYDEIVSIEDGECPTYDVHVPDGHEYGANGFFSHNTKIRGLRANYILADEMASINEEVFNVVIQGFAVVAQNPVEVSKEAMRIAKLKDKGLWTKEMEVARIKGLTGNQIVYSGTAYYAFNHFYKIFSKWHKIISSKGDPSKLKDVFQGMDSSLISGFDYRDYAIVRLPSEFLPMKWQDEGIVAQAKATLSKSQYDMEYNCIFVTDSDGFYKRSIIEAATTNKPILVSSGKYIQFNPQKEGSEDKAYIMGVDPAADADNAAITIIEVNEDHRKVVNCWTTNKKKYAEYKKHMLDRGIKIEDDYYRYISRKIRDLMSKFNIERIVMDKGGGGTAIAEALSSKLGLCDDEYPIFPIIDPENPKPTDIEVGIHILELIVPNSEMNSEANHGMLKDFQDKVLLFPKFDTIEMARQLEFEKEEGIDEFDSYEALVEEIEELKTEICTIVVTPSSILGREVFDTPQIKSGEHKKGRLRKDRYSALLYCNYYARNKDKKTVIQIKYKAVGGSNKTSGGKISGSGGSLYSGPGMMKFGNSDWLKKGGGRYLKKK